MVNFKAVEEEVEQGLLDEVDALCETVAPEAKAKSIEAQIREDLKAFKKKCADGFGYCVEAIKELSGKDPEIRFSRFKNNIMVAFNTLASSAKVEEFGSKAANGSSWTELLGFNEETTQTLYKACKYLFDEERYQEAEAAFSFITAFDASNYAFWLGLGHAAFHCGNYSKALQAYAMAHCCDQAAVWPHMYAANTFEALHNYKRALFALDLAIQAQAKSSHKDTGFTESIKQRIELVKARAQGVAK